MVVGDKSVVVGDKSATVGDSASAAAAASGPNPKSNLSRSGEKNAGPEAENGSGGTAAGGKEEQEEEERGGHEMDVEEELESRGHQVLDGVLLVQYLWGRRGRGGFGGGRPPASPSLPSSPPPTGAANADGNGRGSSQVTSATITAAATTTTTTTTNNNNSNNNGKGNSNGNDNGRAGGVDRPATAAAAADVGASLTPALSRDLRRSYLAQSLARVVGVAGIVRDARRAGYRGGSGAETTPLPAPGGVRQFGTGVGSEAGGVRGSSVHSGGDEQQQHCGWGGAQEQATAAVEALDDLDRGVEELLNEVCVRACVKCKEAFCV